MSIKGNPNLYPIYTFGKCLIRTKRLDKKLANNHAKYYIIRRDKNPGSGLCALLTVFLAEIDYAIKHGYIPVIDLKTYKNSIIDDEDVGKNNAWDNFFLQPLGISIDCAIDTNNYYISDTCNGLFEPSWDTGFLYNDRLIRKWSALFSKYVVINDGIMSYIRNNQIIKHPENTLGCLCRGTDYVRLKPAGHPRQPQVSDVISKAETIMKQYNYSYIFLATEDMDIMITFKKYFGEKLIIDNSLRYKNTDNYSLPEIKRDREKDRFISTRDYILTLSLLSNCDSLISGRTSASPIILFMNNGKYKYKYFYDLGVY